MKLPKTGVWQVVTSRSDFLSLEQEWDDLFRKNPRHSPFQAWGWVAAWLDYLAGPHDLRIIVCRNDEGQLQFILPMIIRNAVGHSQAATAQSVCAYGPECSDHVGCLRLPVYDSHIAEITVTALNRFFGDRSRIVLRNLECLDDYPQKLESILYGQSRAVRLKKDAVCPAISLPGSWDVYLKGISSNFRSQIRRHIKRIANDKSLRFRSVGISDSATFARDIVRLNRTRMGTKGKKSSLESEDFRKFMYEVVPHMAAKNIAWMDVLEDRGRVVGSALNLVHGDTVYFYMGGFDESAKSLRPGTVLFAHVIKRCIENGYSKYDFLRGAEIYKYRWGATDEFTYRLDVYPAGVIRGRLPWVLDGLNASLRAAIRRGLGRPDLC